MTLTMNTFNSVLITEVKCVRKPRDVDEPQEH